MRALLQVLVSLVTPRLGMLALLLLQSPVQAQSAGSQLPVSIDRIRAGLQQPPSPFRVPATSGDIPTFHVEVQQRLFVFRPDDEKPFDPTFGLPSVGELLMDGIAKIGSAAKEHKRAHAQHRARKDVDAALAAFCAVRECPVANPGK